MLFRSDQRQVLEHDRDAERDEQDVLVLAVTRLADNEALQQVAGREHQIPFVQKDGCLLFVGSITSFPSFA